LADSNCVNIGLWADLSGVIPIIVYSRAEMSQCQIPYRPSW